MAQGDALEAEQMTAMLSGFVFGSLQNLKDVLVKPIKWQTCEPNGEIRFKLASGMIVNITINVEPTV